MSIACHPVSSFSPFMAYLKMPSIPISEPIKYQTGHHGPALLTTFCHSIHSHATILAHFLFGIINLLVLVSHCDTIKINGN